VAHDTGDGRLHAPSAARNAGAIADLLERAMKDRPASCALEIASGTGQHVVINAARLPHLT
jgi:tRNA G46 methylase TrmB